MAGYSKSGNDEFETTLDDGSEEYNLIVEFDWEAGQDVSYDEPGHPGGVFINVIRNADNKKEMSLSGFSKKQMSELEEEALEYLNDKAEGAEASYADHKMDEMREEEMMRSSETVFASTEEAIQYLADQTNKKIIIGTEEDRKFLKRGPQDGTGPNGNTQNCSINAEEEDEESEEEGQEVYLRETMIDDNHKLVLEDEKDGKYEVEIYEITDAGTQVVKEYNFTRLEEAQAKYDELLPKEEEPKEEPKEEPEKAEGEGKMAEDLIFASSEEALQHLADITGKKIMVAGNKSTFPCPDCGTKVLENTKYCVKCKKKVEKK